MPIEIGIYTLTPTHCGTGQAHGAVDLPIAREAHTRHPILPASSLKGVLRDRVTDEKERNTVFGPPPPKDGSEGKLEAGTLVITDGQLLAFPVRALDAAFYWITCPLIVRRWTRTGGGLGVAMPDVANLPGVFEAVATSSAQRVVVEDRVVPRVLLKDLPGGGDVAKRWAALAPEDDDLTARLVCVSDVTFADLVERATPVRARVQLDDETKTTDNGGNLWYEETLPPDALFGTFVTSRNGKPSQTETTVTALLPAKMNVIQVGGHETVGQGFCAWRYAPTPKVEPGTKPATQTNRPTHGGGKHGR